MRQVETKNETAEMNRFLKGIHMGGSTFKNYLDKAKDSELKKELKNIIESFKRHEEAITNRIEDMGADAADSLGLFGLMGDFFEKIKLMTANTDREICNHAIDAMKMGIKQGNKFKEENKKLDKSLLKEVQGVLDDYDNHLRKIQQIMGKFE